LAGTSGTEALMLIARRVEQDLQADDEVSEENITTFTQELSNFVAAIIEFHEGNKTAT